MQLDLFHVSLGFCFCRSGTKVFRVDSGEITGYLEWEENVIHETGADYLLMGVSNSIDGIHLVHVVS